MAENLFGELKRRQVFKAGAAYLIVAWLAVQGASIGFPAFDAPPWALRVFILVALLGFPVTLVMAWVFESTPEGLQVDAAATGTKWGDPHLVDETLERVDFIHINRGDVVGIGIHTGNALRGYEIGREARARGAWVVYGGIHATLFPDEVLEHGAAHAVVKGDGDRVWELVVEDCFAGRPQPR